MAFERLNSNLVTSVRAHQVYKGTMMCVALPVVMTPSIMKNFEWTRLLIGHAWVILRWSGVKLSPENRPLIYQLLLPALQPEQEPDLVVRLTAAKALKIVIDDFEFCTEEVKPHLQVIFQSLFQLLQQVGYLIFFFSFNDFPTRPHQSPGKMLKSTRYNTIKACSQTGNYLH